MSVLVTAADQRHSLAVIRALGSQGVEVIAAGSRKDSLGFASRYVHGTALHPSLSGSRPDHDAFVSAILEIVKQRGVDFVFPVAEAHLIALDERREAFDGLARLAIPPSESLRLAIDKKATLSLAEELGIPIPRTCFPASGREALEFAERVGYPIVMKPRGLPSLGAVDGSFAFKVRYVLNRNDLGRAIDRFSKAGGFPILEEFCAGIGVGQSGFAAGGELVGIYQHRRAREYPLTGGVASVVVSEELDESVLGWTRELLRAMKWDGIAQVEYRRNPETGRTVLLEVNGRVWATISAANQLGLNFPYAAYRWVKDGVKVPLATTYPVGKRTRYLRGDIRGLEHYLRGETVVRLQPLPGKARAIWNVLLDFSPRTSGDVWDWRDLRPGIREALSILIGYGRRLQSGILGIVWRRPIHRLFWTPRRWQHLSRIIEANQSRKILEVGTYKARHAIEMIDVAKKFHPAAEVEYVGFDLFEQMTAAIQERELAHDPPVMAEVKERLEGTGANIRLYPGMTEETLPRAIQELPPMDLILIDGGHSIETITNDWNCVRQLMDDNTVVVFDDYYSDRDDAGCKPVVQEIDRDEYDVEVLPPQDRYRKPDGILRVNFVRVKKRT